LAQVYGVDEESCRLAGLLHDWDRDRSASELEDSAAAASLDITAADKTVPYLLHAKTGSTAVRDTFPGIEDVIVRAIATHTVGADGIDDTGMVVYIADMLEPARAFPGVGDIREVVGMVDLEGLYARCYELSLLHLIENHRPLHPDTVAAWNALVAGDGR
jgi:predicted HD superfamily hydrolase involved in NAD metabolism